MANILFLEPFYGGSHKNFADNLVRRSRHTITLVTMPARYWKWRMRGAALHFIKQIPNPEHYDLLFMSGLMSLADLKAMWGPRCPKTIVYFHENQLSYPVPPGSRIDYQFGFTDITTALNADKILFNSHFHMNAFFDELPKFISRMPEYIPRWIPDELQKKSDVLYPGVEDPGTICTPAPTEELNKNAPLIIWNHRWEFDKQPEVFFKALKHSDKIPFNLALLGENFQVVPKPFIAAKKHYGKRIIQYGWCDSRDDYFKLLRQGHLTISTAIQENFGISVIESILAGAFPLLPDRLSYPELVPPAHKDLILYKTDKELVYRIQHILKNGIDPKIKNDIILHYRQYSWNNIIAQYDALFNEL